MTRSAHTPGVHAMLLPDGDLVRNVAPWGVQEGKGHDIPTTTSWDAGCASSTMILCVDVCVCVISTMCEDRDARFAVLFCRCSRSSARPSRHHNLAPLSRSSSVCPEDARRIGIRLKVRDSYVQAINTILADAQSQPGLDFPSLWLDTRDYEDAPSKSGRAGERRHRAPPIPSSSSSPFVGSVVVEDVAKWLLHKPDTVDLDGHHFGLIDRVSADDRSLVACVRSVTDRSTAIGSMLVAIPPAAQAPCSVDWSSVDGRSCTRRLPTPRSSTRASSA
nr:hypothetical protein CFP56_12082 [Quercus suber]